MIRFQSRHATLQMNRAAGKHLNFYNIYRKSSNMQQYIVYKSDFPAAPLPHAARSCVYSAALLYSLNGLSLAAHTPP